MPEMVFLLGQMGDNKKALTLIIERLGDVNRVRDLPPTNDPSLTSVQAIDFAKEQNDHDLWEDLLKYSESRPGTQFCYHPFLSLLTSFSVHPRLARERRPRN